MQCAVPCRGIPRYPSRTGTPILPVHCVGLHGGMGMHCVSLHSGTNAFATRTCNAPCHAAGSPDTPVTQELLSFLFIALVCMIWGMGMHCVSLHPGTNAFATRTCNAPCHAAGSPDTPVAQELLSFLFIALICMGGWACIACPCMNRFAPTGATGHWGTCATGCASWLYAARTWMVKVLPLPGVLSTVARPPWAWAMCFTMARPSPVPPRLRLRALSTR